MFNNKNNFFYFYKMDHAYYSKELNSIDNCSCGLGISRQFCCKCVSKLRKGFEICYVSIKAPNMYWNFLILEIKSDREYFLGNLAETETVNGFETQINRVDLMTYVQAKCDSYLASHQKIQLIIILLRILKPS